MITSMALIELPPYLWPANGRSRQYWYYRRDGHRIPIATSEFPGDLGFFEAYERLHASFEGDKATFPQGRTQVIIGTIGHAVPLFFIDPETQGLARKTRQNYRQYLNELITPHREGESSHAHRLLAKLTPEVVRKLRDERQDMPWTANSRLAAIGAFLTWVEGRPIQFRLPTG
jgi:hypothetical protein